MEEISFSVEQGGVTTILAPTGAGKSSLLKILSGLEDQSSGNIQDNSKKKIFIPSEPSSFPWFNVKENVTFNYNKFDETKLQKIINLVGLEGYKDHNPHKKSLGFRFRISLARALFNDSEVLIIDEPFSKMRDEIRKDIYQLIRKIKQEMNLTVIFGTSNISEAILLSDKIFVMDKDPGRILNSFSISFHENSRTNFSESIEYSNYKENIKEYLSSINPSRILNISL